MPDWFFKVLMLTLGGAVGTNARYWLGVWARNQGWVKVFPWHTFFINISGSFILGVVSVLLVGRVPPEKFEPWLLLLGVGFCGGYTTFSTFSLETLQLISDGSWGLALLNIVGSVVGGFIAVLLAVSLTRNIFPPD